VGTRFTDHLENEKETQLVQLRQMKKVASEHNTEQSDEGFSNISVLPEAGTEEGGGANHQVRQHHGR
jgi:hypothetical protein